MDERQKAAIERANRIQEAFRKGYGYTDELRKDLWMDDAIINNRSCIVKNVSSQEYLDGLYEKATPEQKRIVEKASNYYDAIKPFWEKKEDSLLMFDLRRGQTLAALSYTRGGANDFNSATKDYCPSAMIAEQFKDGLGYFDYYKNFYKGAIESYDKYLKEQPDCEMVKNVERNITGMNDLLFMYKRLKEGRGLNMDVINKLKNKDEILATFKKMDKLLETPEKNRFRDQLTQQKEEKKEKGVLSVLKKKVNGMKSSLRKRVEKTTQKATVKIARAVRKKTAPVKQSTIAQAAAKRKGRSE